MEALRRLDSAQGRGRKDATHYHVMYTSLLWDYKPAACPSAPGLYMVRSARPGCADMYTVDASAGLCTCDRGRRRQLCKHQLAVMVAFPSQHSALQACNADSATRSLYLQIAHGAAVAPPGAEQAPAMDVTDMSLDWPGDESPPASPTKGPHAGSELDHTPKTTRRLEWLGGKVGVGGEQHGSPEKLGQFIKMVVELMNDPEYRNGMQARQIAGWLVMLQHEFGSLVSELENRKGSHEKTIPSRVVEALRGMSTMSDKTAYSKSARMMKDKKHRWKVFKKGKAGRKTTKKK